jgi:stage III sporulation protein AG
MEPEEKKNKQWLWQRLRKLNPKEKSLFFKLAVILLVGIVLMSLTGGNKDESDNAGDTASEPVAQSYYSEEAALEAKLVAILAQVKGAGKVSVALTFEEGTESVYAEESNETLSEDQTESSSALAEINDNPVLIKQRLPKVQGVVIVAEGAGDPLVKERLYEAARSLLGLTAAQIAIIEGDMTL